MDAFIIYLEVSGTFLEIRGCGINCWHEQREFDRILIYDEWLCCGILIIVNNSYINIGTEMSRNDKFK